LSTGSGRSLGLYVVGFYVWGSVEYHGGFYTWKYSSLLVKEYQCIRILLSWARSSYLMGDDPVLYRTLVALDSQDSRTIPTILLVRIVALGRLSYHVTLDVAVRPTSRPFLTNKETVSPPRGSTVSATSHWA
jgi:hypothetical protein